jgi:hypothetical protein
MFVFESFLAYYGTKFIELDISLMETRREIQWDHIQLLIIKIELTMSDFQILLNLGGVVIWDPQDCMQLGVNQELPPHATRIGLLCGQHDL